MNPRTVRHIMRLEGLTPFTGCAILIGLVVTMWEVGIYQADWVLFIIAVIAASLIHIDAHIWNDIMDLEIDRREKSAETGRDRPLIFGWASISEYRMMSAAITSIAIILAVYLTLFRIYIPVLFAIGLFFDYGYNHPRFALGHRPFTELYIFPWLVVVVTVTIVYAATNILSPLAFILSLLHGMTVTCFAVSMMRRDAPSDKLGNKCTSSVKYPGVPHSTVYGIATMMVTIIMIYPLAIVVGSLFLAYLLCLTTAVIAVVNTVLGAEIDQLCTRALYSVFPDFEAKANKLMLQQVGASMVHAATISVVLLLFGGIL
jgi:1,4-dihydroxy-2-naphthoate octaprenyltransferase